MVHPRFHVGGSETPLLHEAVVIHHDRDVSILRLNEEHDGIRITVDVDPGTIQFHFSANSPLDVVFAGGRYVRPLPAESSFLIYDPRSSMRFDVVAPAGASWIAVLMKLDALHGLFLEDFHELHFLRPENVDRQFHQQRLNTARIMSAVSDMLKRDIADDLIRIHVVAKAYELLYHYFDADSSPLAERCPFLVDESNVERIRAAKKILHDNLREPPNIRDLARRIGLNENHLKQGFKRIYGCPIYTWVVEQRMARARLLLESGKYKVNEVADEIGYVNPSQFISAFKRRYGVTPGRFVSAGAVDEV